MQKNSVIHLRAGQGSAKICPRCHGWKTITDIVYHWLITKCPRCKGTGYIFGHL